MPVTKYHIANRALLKLGSSTLSSFEESTTQSTITAQIYESFIKSLLTKSNWHFAMKKQQLTRLDATPINEWQYKYTIPVDLLKLRSVWESDQIHILSTDEYEIFESRTLYSNKETLWVDYIYRIDESYWPYYFIEFVISALAAQLAMPMTRIPSLAQLFHAEAYGAPTDNSQGGLYAEAVRQDAAQNPSEPLRLNFLTGSRFSLGGYNYYD